MAAPTNATARALGPAEVLAQMCAAFLSGQNSDGTAFSLPTGAGSQTFFTTGDLNGALLTQSPAALPVFAAPAANTAAVVTIAGVAGQRVRLMSLQFSVGGTIAAAVAATVADGTTTYTYDIGTTVGVLNINLPPGGVAFAVGATVTITLPALGAAGLSRINASRLIA